MFCRQYYCGNAEPLKRTRRGRGGFVGPRIPEHRSHAARNGAFSRSFRLDLPESEFSPSLGLVAGRSSAGFSRARRGSRDGASEG